ncbi:hypothetical protein [Asanoa siamensis]|uniref:Uncharacterized protein n=1 Tax=Asanoa siamensis TaxID=926357 RepID=A0ABQ4CR86_9ACTN|nr:hypothetical protein [Asanoa siamensis]GIF73800.1 hypothetical protein Asi02nite_33180 [Asanoa siamensis]
MDVESTAAALRAVSDHDPSLLTEPARLARALRDLLPDDDHAVRLLVVAARTGLPGLLAGGHAREARNRLTDHAGLRAEVAEQLVSAWIAASTGEVRSSAADRPGFVSERPGVPTAVAVQPGPAGAAVVGLVTGSGVFVGDGSGWRRVATPTATVSRDVALADHHVFWSGAGGVFARPVTTPGGVVSLGEQRTVVTADQVRYPLAAVSGDGESVDVFWTPDRVRIAHRALRGWATGSGVDIGAVPGAGRLAALAAGAAGPRAMWLAALTESGTLAYAAWDPAGGGLGRWTALAPPVPIAALTLAGGVLLGCTAAGHLLAYDLAGARTWRSVDPPAQAPRPERAPHALAAAPGLLVVAAARFAWLATVSIADGVPTLGAARPLDL